MATNETGETLGDGSGNLPTEQLVHAYLDGVLTESDRIELVARLTSDPAAADLFARATRFESLLASYLVEERSAQGEQARTAQAGSDVAAAVPSRRNVAAAGLSRPLSSVRLPLRSVGRIAAFAASLAAAFVIGWFVISNRTPHENPAGGEGSPIARAAHQVVSGRVLVDGVEAGRFFDGARLEVVGDQEAVVRLADGTELELSPAAAAVIDAADDEAIVRLDYGNAKVRGDERRRLRIDTPAGVVSGRGAEFAVDVSSPTGPSTASPTTANTGSTAETGGSSIGPNLPALLIVAVLTGQVEVSQSDGKEVVTAGSSREFSAEKKPMFAGRIVEVAADGKRITLEGKPGKPGTPPERREIKLSDAAESIYYGVPLEADRPTVGYTAIVMLNPHDPGSAASVEYGDKNPSFAGPVREASEDGRTLKVEVYRKGDTPETRTVSLDDRTRTSYTGVDGSDRRPTVGYQAQVWLAHAGDSATDRTTERAVDIRFVYKSKGPAKTENPKSEKPKSEKPEPAKKPTTKTEPPTKEPMKPTPEKKPATDKNVPEKNVPEKNPAVDKTQPEKKPPVDKSKPADKNAPTEKKPNSARPNPESKTQHAPALSTVEGKPQTQNTVLPVRRTERDPAPISAEIDRAIDAGLEKAGIPASPAADDAEFLRRAAIDVTGRIPDLATTLAFLAETDPNKRTRLVNSLLDDPNYGRRFAAVWKRLIQPRPPAGGKPQTDRFTPWLAEQINANRGWNEIVHELITTEADLVRDGRSYFLVVNSESFDPKPNLLAASTARLFLGVQLGCAECHDHPFAEWKQTEFWNLAAFYGRLHKRSKQDFTWTEDPSDANLIDAVPTITIPDNGGKAAGKVVPALYLGGGTPRLQAGQPLRQVLADWVTTGDNPYFARAAVNRLWAHFFGRGLVEPLDGFQADYEASHPEVLERLAREFVASDYDVRHLVRIITATRAYRRTSRPSDVAAAGPGRPIPENQNNELLDRMTIKAFDPDVLYDSITAAVNADPTPTVAPASNSRGIKVKVSRPDPVSIGPRDEFVGFFTSVGGDAGPTRYTHGIPQLLRLMNGETFNVGTPTARAVAAAPGTTDEKIETIYLVALARRPTDAERTLMNEYVAKAGTAKQVGTAQQKDAGEQTWSDVLWILLNSSEFQLNR